MPHGPVLVYMGEAAGRSSALAQTGGRQVVAGWWANWTRWRRSSMSRQVTGAAVWRRHGLQLREVERPAGRAADKPASSAGHPRRRVQPGYRIISEIWLGPEKRHIAGPGQPAASWASLNAAAIVTKSPAHQRWPSRQAQPLERLAPGLTCAALRHSAPGAAGPRSSPQPGVTDATAWSSHLEASSPRRQGWRRCREVCRQDRTDDSAAGPPPAIRQGQTEQVIGCHSSEQGRVRGVVLRTSVVIGPALAVRGMSMIAFQRSPWTAIWSAEPTRPAISASAGRRYGGEFAWGGTGDGRRRSRSRANDDAVHTTAYTKNVSAKLAGGVGQRAGAAAAGCEGG